MTIATEIRAPARDEATNVYGLFKIARLQFDCVPAELTPEQRRQAEKQLAVQAQLEKAVLSSELAVSVVVPDEGVDAALRELERGFDSESAFLAALDAAGLDRVLLRQALARELRVDAVLDRVAASLPAVTETDAQLYYLMHPERFERPETRTARHILITVNEDFPENSSEAARQRLDAIARRLERKPGRFAEQAQKHSECPTAMQGGLLGRVPKGQLFPELDARLFQLREGEISEVLRSPLGFHLLYCEQIYPAGTVPLDEILPRLREQLEARQRKQHQRDWIRQQLVRLSD